MLFRRVPVTYTTDVGGDVAQLGERRTRIAEVVGSNPIVSTRNSLISAEFVKPRTVELLGNARNGTKRYSAALDERRVEEASVR